MRKKILFILPPKNWFYGIDYKSSHNIVNLLKTKHNLQVILFDDIEIFLKKDKNIFDLVKIIFLWIKFKFTKINFVIAKNSSYILLCGLVYKKKYFNFFSQLLKLKCILRWDHINEQMPSIVENIESKMDIKSYNKINNSEKDYRDIFFSLINHKNFEHFSWQNDEYISTDQLLISFHEKYNIKIKNLPSFHFNRPKNKLKKKNNKIALAGYINNTINLKLKNKFIAKKLKNINNFYNKKFYIDLIKLCEYQYNQKKMNLLKISDFEFYGINTKLKNFTIQNPQNFFSNLSNFFLIVNPLNPISQTLTTKFYQIFLYDGFCINEMPQNIPKKLLKYKEFIFYKSERDLIEKIEFLKKNKSRYLDLKKNIKKISNDYYNYSYLNFENFLKKYD